MSEYAQRYLDALLQAAHREAPIEGAKVLGEIKATTAKQPHIAFYVRLGEGRSLGSTAGLSARPIPLPIQEGFQYFELCALTRGDSPRILWLLSNLGAYMLATSSPFFYGDPAQHAASGAVPEPKGFLPYQTLQLGGDGSRFLFVPRFRFVVPEGPPVEVVEPLPITEEQWRELGPMTLDARGAWASALGERAPDQWRPLLELA